MHSLEIVQWDSTRRDHPGYPIRVFGSGPVIYDRVLTVETHLLQDNNPQSLFCASMGLYDTKHLRKLL